MVVVKVFCVILVYDVVSDYGINCVVVFCVIVFDWNICVSIVIYFVICNLDILCVFFFMFRSGFNVEVIVVNGVFFNVYMFCVVNVNIVCWVFIVVGGIFVRGIMVYCIVFNDVVLCIIIFFGCFFVVDYVNFDIVIVLDGIVGDVKFVNIFV